MLTSLAASALIVGATTYNIAFFITMYITSFLGVCRHQFASLLSGGKLCDTQSIKVPLTWISEQYLHD